MGGQVDEDGILALLVLLALVEHDGERGVEDRSRRLLELRLRLDERSEELLDLGVEVGKERLLLELALDLVPLLHVQDGLLTGVAGDEEPVVGEGLGVERFRHDVPFQRTDVQAKRALHLYLG